MPDRGPHRLHFVPHLGVHRLFIAIDEDRGLAAADCWLSSGYFLAMAIMSVDHALPHRAWFEVGELVFDGIGHCSKLDYRFPEWMHIDTFAQCHF